MWDDNPALYEVARQTCHEFGLDWTDPRTGKTHKASKAAKAARAAKLRRLGLKAKTRKKGA